MLQLTSGTPGITVQPDRNLFAERVRGEFREMPGLTLNLAQASRLWSLDAPTCNEVLTGLVAAGFLRRKADGTYARASDLAVGPTSSVRGRSSDGRPES